MAESRVRPSLIPSADLRYKRVLLKISGEALCNPHGDRPDAFGIQTEMLNDIAKELGEVHALGVQLGLVIGGGNIFRGLKGAASGMERAQSDTMGMLATVMNGLALRDALERSNIQSHVMSAIPMSGVVEHYDRRRAIRYLEQGDVVIFAAGTGNPFFTTDSAACLRGIEVDAELVLKATKVDGVYDSDPMKNPGAKMYERLTYDEALDKKLGVMDLTAICLCREHNMPVRVFRMSKAGALLNIVVGGNEGTLMIEESK